MQITYRDKFLQGLGTGVVAATIAILLWSLGRLDWWEVRTWDWRVTYLCRPGPATDKIRLILLDQGSLDWAVQENQMPWPWPRDVYKHIIEFCKRCGVKAIVFDIMFPDPSPYGVADDQGLGTAFAQGPASVAPVLLGSETGNVRTWPDGIPVFSWQPDITKAWRSQASSIIMPRATFPIPEIAQNVTLLANVQATPDADGVNRRVRLLSLFDNKLVPNLGLAAFLASAPRVPVKIAPRTISIGDKQIPLDRQGCALVRYRGPGGVYQRFSAAAVIQSEIRLASGESPTIPNLELFKDSYVFFGGSAPGLLDLRMTPVGGRFSGVEIHATLLDNLLSGDFLQESPWFHTLFFTILLSMLCGIAVSFSRGIRGTLLVFAIFLALPVVLVTVAYQKGYWLPFLVEEMAVVLAFTGSVVVNYATEGKQRRFIKNAFRQYLSPAIIEQLIQHPERLKLGGERRLLSIFFSDLQGFTGISEHLSPEALAAFLNNYFTAMTEIIQEKEGIVDKYVGDAIIAFWNAPLPQEDHGIRAVDAALRCQATLAQLRLRFHNEIGKDVFMRIGINTGYAVVGNLGSQTRFDYTMIGDTVNLASRLEGVNKYFGTYTLISDTTRALVGSTFAVREISRVEVVGRKEPVQIFEPMFWEDFTARKEILERFAQALALYYKGDFAEGLTHFQELAPHDPPARAYAKKCQTLLEHPPASWQGVWVMTDK